LGYAAKTSVLDLTATRHSVIVRYIGVVRDLSRLEWVGLGRLVPVDAVVIESDEEYRVGGIEWCASLLLVKENRTKRRKIV
jgi:hypothetical protein